MTVPLPDTSVWVQHLRGVSVVTERLRPWIDEGTAAVCEPIVMELLSGVGARGVNRMEEMLDRLPSLPFEPALDFRVAADIQRRVRANGHTLRSPMDALIAAVVLRSPDVVLIHDDTDFDRIAAVVPLSHERWCRQA